MCKHIYIASLFILVFSMVKFRSYRGWIMEDSWGNYAHVDVGTDNVSPWFAEPCELRGVRFGGSG